MSHARCLRLHPELQGEIADSMTLEVALLWRTVCRGTYTQVTASLGRSLRRLLSAYIPHVTPFLQLLTDHRAVVGGIVALAFVLRDEGLRGGPLQVYAAESMYQSFVDRLLLCPSNKPYIAVTGTGTPKAVVRSQREILEFMTVQFTGRPVVVIYRSASSTPISCIARAHSSALMNFVTAHSVGCAFPRSTLKRRSILCDFHLPNQSSTDIEVMDILLRNGFHFAISATAWPDVVTSDRPHTVENTVPCVRVAFLCPLQGRYFGDAGSVVALVDPLGPELAGIRVLGVPPYGPMAAWRLATSFDCSIDCDEDDGVLDSWLTSAPLIVMPSPYPVYY